MLHYNPDELNEVVMWKRVGISYIREDFGFIIVFLVINRMCETITLYQDHILIITSYQLKLNHMTSSMQE